MTDHDINDSYVDFKTVVGVYEMNNTSDRFLLLLYWVNNVNGIMA